MLHVLKSHVHKPLIQKILNSEITEPPSKYVEEFILKSARNMQRNLFNDWFTQKIRSRECGKTPVKTFKALWLIHRHINLKETDQSHFEVYHLLIKSLSVSLDNSTQLRDKLTLTSIEKDERSLDELSFNYAKFLCFKLDTLQKLEKYIDNEYNILVNLNIFVSMTSKATMANLFDGLVESLKKSTDLMLLSLNQSTSVFMPAVVIGLDEQLKETARALSALSVMIQGFKEFIRDAEYNQYNTKLTSKSANTLFNWNPTLEHEIQETINLIDLNLESVFSLSNRRFYLLKGNYELLMTTRNSSVAILSNVFDFDDMPKILYHTCRNVHDTCSRSLSHHSIGNKATLKHKGSITCLTDDSDSQTHRVSEKLNMSRSRSALPTRRNNGSNSIVYDRLTKVSPQKSYNTCRKPTASKSHHYTQGDIVLARHINTKKLDNSSPGSTNISEADSDFEESLTQSSYSRAPSIGRRRSDAVKIIYKERAAIDGRPFQTSQQKAELLTKSNIGEIRNRFAMTQVHDDAKNSEGSVKLVRCQNKNAAHVAHMQKAYGTHSRTSAPEQNVSGTKAKASAVRTQKPEQSGLDGLEVNLSEIIIDRIIGHGASSQVFKGQWRGTVVAVKHMQSNASWNHRESSAVLREFYREVGVMLRLRHPNLVLFMGAKTQGDKLCVITEYCDGGNLFDLLHNSNKAKRHNPRPPINLSWAQKLKICLDIARACQYLHTSNPAIIHRDLKSLNVLLAYEIRSSNDIPVAKVSDFGLSRIKAGAQDSWGHLTGMAGTYYWMAPEIIMNKPYNEKADVYSFSILMYEIFTQKTPYYEIEDRTSLVSIAADVAKGRRPTLQAILPDTPPELVELMKQCWHADPKWRPDFEEIATKLNASVESK